VKLPGRRLHLQLEESIGATLSSGEEKTSSLNWFLGMGCLVYLSLSTSKVLIYVRRWSVLTSPVQVTDLRRM
jgi:hypothetical protein